MFRVSRDLRAKRPKEKPEDDDDDVMTFRFPRKSGFCDRKGFKMQIETSSSAVVRRQIASILLCFVSSRLHHARWHHLARGTGG
jgi:hypothetical protein